MLAKAVADILWKGRYASGVEDIVDMLEEISELSEVQTLLEERRINEQGLNKHSADTEE